MKPAHELHSAILMVVLYLVHSVASIQVEKKIGQGQFSVVYRARNTVNGQIVALKKIQVTSGSINLS